MKKNGKEEKILALRRELESLFIGGGWYNVFTQEEVARRIEIIDELEKMVNKKFAEKLRKTRLPRPIEVGFIPTYATLTKTSRTVNDLASPNGLYPEFKNIKFPEGVFVGHKTVQCKVKLVDEGYEKYKLASIPRRGLMMLDSDERVSVVDVSQRRKRRKDSVYFYSKFLSKACYFSDKTKKEEAKSFSFKLFILEGTPLYDEDRFEALSSIIEEVNMQFNKIAEIEGLDKHQKMLSICP
jgi:hypothetical protein